MTLLWCMTVAGPLYAAWGLGFAAAGCWAAKAWARWDDERHGRVR